MAAFYVAMIQFLFITESILSMVHKGKVAKSYFTLSKSIAWNLRHLQQKNKKSMALQKVSI